MPSDVAVDIGGNRASSIKNQPIEASFDMGITSVRALSKAIKNAGTIILNGPAGVFERTDFALGTVEMLNACAGRQRICCNGRRTYYIGHAWLKVRTCFNRWSMLGPSSRKSSHQELLP